MKQKSLSLLFAVYIGCTASPLACAQYSESWKNDAAGAAFDKYRKESKVPQVETDEFPTLLKRNPSAREQKRMDVAPGSTPELVVTINRVSGANPTQEQLTGLRVFARYLSNLARGDYDKAYQDSVLQFIMPASEFVTMMEARMRQSDVADDGVTPVGDEPKKSLLRVATAVRRFAPEYLTVFSIKAYEDTAIKVSTMTGSKANPLGILPTASTTSLFKKKGRWLVNDALDYERSLLAQPMSKLPKSAADRNMNHAINNAIPPPRGSLFPWPESFSLSYALVGDSQAWWQYAKSDADHSIELSRLKNDDDNKCGHRSGRKSVMQILPRWRTDNDNKRVEALFVTLEIEAENYFNPGCAPVYEQRVLVKLPDGNWKVSDFVFNEGRR